MIVNCAGPGPSSGSRSTSVDVTASCMSASRLEERYQVSPAPVTVPTDPAAIAEGERLYLARGCIDCHDRDAGGKVMIDDAPGRIVGANLTKTVREYEDIDLVRAIRHGVARDGRPLIMMPSAEYYFLPDVEVGALIAYLRTLPEVERDLPSQELRLLGSVLHVTGATVGIGKYRHGLDTQLFAGADHPAGNFTPVGDEETLDIHFCLQLGVSLLKKQ